MQYLMNTKSFSFTFTENKVIKYNGALQNISDHENVNIYLAHRSLPEKIPLSFQEIRALMLGGVIDVFSFILNDHAMQ